ncbi:hypothetical protein GCM10011506_06620 [Marivirga lumbricoides]|uniref:DZANK-type domain-containing protein n=1 Tax=Marivirga lumbricoides TaxID=1046115 RepID=A0ABQ1LFT1_9BACT|nr:hypothetical protein GCM10011506_06620 [Marivirga lumbricoides]
MHNSLYFNSFTKVSAHSNYPLTEYRDIPISPAKVKALRIVSNNLAAKPIDIMAEENNMNKLLINILKAKGLTEEQVSALEQADITSKADFEYIGDFQTLMDISGIDEETSKSVMAWALGNKFESNTSSASAGATPSAPIIVESADVVKCTHCGARQPKDYQTGDLCLSCGHQAEPVLNCHWCLNSGPGKFCRECGSEFLSASDYEIGIFLKREGESKNAIVKLVKEMTPQEKDSTWAKIRKTR